VPTSSAAQPTTDARADRRWHEAVDEHRAALAAYLETAEEVRDDAWTRPLAPGKWSPAEVTEHVTLAYEVLLVELREGRGMRVKGPPWRRTLLRWVLLPHILFHGTIPLRPPAPRELRPGPPRAPRAEALRILRDLGERFEHEMTRARAAGGGWITHPYFGTVEPVKGMRFVGIHLEHHRKQVARAG
jgi:DinB superfamily